MNGVEIITLLTNSIGTVASAAVNSVAGALLTVIFLRRNTKVDEFEKIKAGQFREVANDLLNSGKMTYTEYYKANNFLDVAKKADKYYQEYYKDTENNKEQMTYDFDWFVRFFEAVGNISDETMQVLWAKILAGEIAKPSSFSLKTIDVMRNISKKEAELFIKICSCSIKSGKSNCFLPREGEFLDMVGIQYVDILKLSEIGLIFNDGNISLTVTINNEPSLLFSNNSLVLLMSSSSGNSEKVNIYQYPFTEVGKELSNMINKNISDENFLNYARLLRSKDQRISVHKVIAMEGDWINCDEIDLLKNQ